MVLLKQLLKMAAPSVSLINGASMPLLGFGTWLSEPKVVGESVKKALEVGYRHIDCAHVYRNEAEIGEVFAKVFSDEDSNVKREDVFITSKLWVTDFGDVQAACNLTLKNLQLKYLDLYLIHLPFEVDPEEFKFPPVPQGHAVIGYKAERIEEVWRQMEKLVDDKKVKAIGVSNFTSHKLKNLLKCDLNVQVACNQIEMSPYLPQHGLKELCEKENVVVVAYSPLGNPGFKMFKTDSEPSVLQDDIVGSVAKKHSVTPAQVLLAYGLHRKTGVLCKSVNEERIKENLESLKVNLDTDDMVALNSITTRNRYVKQNWALKADEVLEDLWDGEING